MYHAQEDYPNPYSPSAHQALGYGHHQQQHGQQHDLYGYQQQSDGYDYGAGHAM